MVKRLGKALAMPALLFVIVTLFYWKLTLTNQYSWMESPDYAYQVLPWYQFQAGEWHAGRIPLWDPYAWAGQSLIGQAQPGAAYPPNWLLFLAPLENGWMRQAYLHWYWVLIHYMAVLFGYWLCRDVRLSRAASAIGGLAFGLGGWMGSIEWPQMLNGALWAPVVTLFLLRVLRGEKEVLNAGLAGAALGMAFLSGHHQAPTFIGLAAAGMWIYGLVLRRWRLAPALALFGVMFALVGALQILPAYEYGKLAVRWVGSANDPVGWKDVVPYKVHSGFGLGPASLPGVIAPTLGRHGSPYIGLMTAALALIGAAARAGRRDVKVLIGIACGGLLFSLSEHTVFHGLVYATAPLVEKARNASFAILMFHFAAAALAAFGVDALAEREKAAVRWAKRVAWGMAGIGALLAAAFVALTLAGNTRFRDEDRVTIVPVLAAVTGGLLWGAGAGKLRRGTAAVGFGLVALAEFSMGGAAYGWRHRSTKDMLLEKLAAHGDIAEFLRRQPGFPRLEVDMDAIPYTFGEWYGIDTFDAYTASIQANAFRAQAEYRARMLLGLNFYLSPKAYRKGQVEAMTGKSGVKLWVNGEAGPRTWAVHEALRIREERLPFAWERELTELRRKPFLTGPAPPMEACDGDQVRMLERLPNRVTVEAEMACRGMVVVSDPYAPGWRAKVDGRETPIYEVYGMMRGIGVAAGKHRIVMEYRPWSVVLGAGFTGLGWAMALLLAYRLQGTRKFSACGVI
jgi:hypothetical protein